MSEPFVHSGLCEAWVLCGQCRTSRAFRASLFEQNAVSSVNFLCPYGFDAHHTPEKPDTLPVTTIVQGTPVYDLPKIWGPRFWKELHCRALHHEGREDSAWIKGFGKRIPCADCRKHWQEALKKHPIGQENYFAWSVKMHNTINQLLGKPVFSLNEALSRWKPEKPSTYPVLT